MVKLDDLTNRREKIIEENKVKRSPSQEREYLLEQVILLQITILGLFNNIL